LKSEVGKVAISHQALESCSQPFVQQQLGFYLNTRDRLIFCSYQ